MSGKVVSVGTHRGGGATEGWRRWRGTMAFWGSAMRCGGRRRWWPAPGALVNVGEVRSGRNLGGKTWGGGAHREAEVAAMVAPKQAEWRGVRCSRRASRPCSAGREGDSARARAKGAERRAMGRRPTLMKSSSVV
jgi:hypothetical protein